MNGTLRSRIERLEQQGASTAGGLFILMGIPDDEPLPGSPVSPCGGLHVLYMRPDEVATIEARRGARG